MKKKIIRSLKSNLFSQLRCLDYFPHMSVFHQERTGFDHHWTRILCVYWAGACPFDLVASFKVGDHKSNVKSVERRGIKIKMTCNSQSLLIDTPVRAKLKSVSERRKSVTTERTNERTDSRSPVYPDLFWRGYKHPIKNE
jgi:histidinol phosphatase-like enzyme